MAIEERRFRKTEIKEKSRDKMKRKKTGEISEGVGSTKNETIVSMENHEVEEKKEKT